MVHSRLPLWPVRKTPAVRGHFHQDSLKGFVAPLQVHSKPAILDMSEPVIIRKSTVSDAALQNFFKIPPVICMPDLKLVLVDILQAEVGTAFPNQPLETLLSLPFPVSENPLLRQPNRFLLETLGNFSFFFYRTVVALDVQMRVCIRIVRVVVRPNIFFVRVCG